MKKLIIVKYAQQSDKWTLDDSVHESYSAIRVGDIREESMPDYFVDRKIAESWLEDLRNFNPSVGYDIVEVSMVSQ